MKNQTNHTTPPPPICLVFLRRLSAYRIRISTLFPIRRSFVALQSRLLNFRALLALLLTLTLSHCTGNSGGGGGPTTTTIYFWITSCVMQGNMSSTSTDCQVASPTNGIGRADAICAKRASDKSAGKEGQYLPSSHTNHKAMLHRGTAAKKHPKDIDIPNKANREVHRLPTSSGTAGIKITDNYNFYWDKDKTLTKAVMDTPSVTFFWSSIDINSVVYSTTHCTNWTDNTNSFQGGYGDAGQRDFYRFSSYTSTPSGASACTNVLPLLCASY